MSVNLFIKEVDLTTNRGGEKIYVQVASLLEKSETAGREFGNLLSIEDSHPKHMVIIDEIREIYSTKL